MQRTGTTSVGKFFQDQGYKVAGYSLSIRNQWTMKWFNGDLESIFSSTDFKKNQVFEDDPWWCLDFYKQLFHRFEDSKFVLFERDANKWFDSMMKHSESRNLGHAYIHAKIYNREREFAQLLKIDDWNTAGQEFGLLELNEEHREHYTDYYQRRNAEVNAFFKFADPDRLISLSLEDESKWTKLGEHFKLNIADSYSVHENQSK